MSAEDAFVEHVAVLASMFTAPPGGGEFTRPHGWPDTPRTAAEVALKDWQDGWAVCAVTGDDLAVVDVDPRNGGDVDKVAQLLDGIGVRVYARVATPGGGAHFYVAGHPDLPKCKDLVGYPGVDVMSHGGHVFLPGTRRPKYDGGGYTVEFDNLPALADGGDQDSAGALAGWVTSNRKAQAAQAPEVSPPWDGTRLTEYQQAYLLGFVTDRAREVAATAPGGRNHAIYEAALRCGNYVSGAGLDEQTVIDHLYGAAVRNGEVADSGAASVHKSIRSGLDNGRSRPAVVPDPLPVLPVITTPVAEAPTYAFVPGGTFILDTAADPEPLWGNGSHVLLADGEALIIAGGQGLGKTTLGQQLALGRCGFPEYADLLGYPIKPGKRRTLYLAMDRPKQVARSFRRMVGDAWRAELDAKLIVWPGPPPGDLAKFPSLLLALCAQADADTVFVDSLKDAAIGLTDDDVGAGYNRARQTAITAGVQVVEMHHQRKRQNTGGERVLDLDDLYGSTWLSSGAGSVLLLSGTPGNPLVKVQHVKQPADQVATMQVQHDHKVGRSRTFHAVDLLVLAQTPISALDAARALFGITNVSPSEKEKARRRLVALDQEGLLKVCQSGAKTTNAPTMWVVA